MEVINQYSSPEDCINYIENIICNLLSDDSDIPDFDNALIGINRLKDHCNSMETLVARMETIKAIVTSPLLKEGS